MSMQSRTTSNSTPLHTALTKGNLQAARWLVSQGCSTFAQYNNGFTCLHAAAWSGSVTCLRWLVQDVGMDVNSTGGAGCTALHATTLEAEGKPQASLACFALLCLGASTHIRDVSRRSTVV